MYFFTSDEHHGHKNIIKYSNRPFNNIHEMTETLIKNHNEVVTNKDTTIHCGDFSFGNKEKTGKIISSLNGHHIFLKGDHDKWLGKSGSYMWKRKIDDIPIVACHYCMRTWWLSHYNSIQVFGHHHGMFPVKDLYKQMDVGVDNNNYYPIPFEDIKRVIHYSPDNCNYINKERKY